MKIRIKGNSLRYRLTRTDVEHLAEDGYLENSTDFGSSTLIYALQKTTAGLLSASFENNTIATYVPQWMVTELRETDRVGFESRESDLYILIEKDFVCLDTVAEDQSDNYPNPLLICN
jgi:hypothetical protein